MKIPRGKILSRSICLCWLAGMTSLRASDGTWISDANGNWSDSGNWNGGAIADGVGATAYFNNSISATRMVTSDVARTNGNLYFIGTGSYGWVLTNTASFILNNASGLATITMDSSNTVTFNASGTGLAGTNAVLKNGVGTLALGWNSTYTGGTFLGAGTIGLNTAAAGQVGTGAVTITNGAILSLYRGSTTDDGSTVGYFTNTISIPAGQSGTIWCSPRSVTGSAGFGFHVHPTSDRRWHPDDASQWHHPRRQCGELLGLHRHLAGDRTHWFGQFPGFLWWQRGPRFSQCQGSSRGGGLHVSVVESAE